MTPRLYDPKRNQNSYPKNHLLNLIICINNSSTNYRRHHFNYLRFCFSFHYLRYSAFSNFYRSHKIKFNGSFLLPTLEFPYLSSRSMLMLMNYFSLKNPAIYWKDPIISFWLLNLIWNLYATSFSSTYDFSFYLGNISLPNWSTNSAIS